MTPPPKATLITQHMDMSLLLVLIGFIVGRLSTKTFYFGRNYDKLRQADAGAVWERDTKMNPNDCRPST